MVIKLTNLEWAIIEHRLSPWGCLTECLEEKFEPNITYETAQTLFYKLKVERVINFEELRPLQIEILKDCLDGSTYFAGDLDAVATKELSRGKFLAQRRAAKSLEKKFNKAGHSVSIPLYKKKSKI